MVFPSPPVPSSVLTGKWLCILAIILLFHATASAIQFRRFVRSTGNEQLNTPLDITLEALISLILACYGASLWAGSFKKILSAPTFHDKTIDNSITFREDFMIFNHRGRELAKLDESVDNTQ